MDQNGSMWQEEAATRLGYARERMDRAEQEVARARQEVAHWKRYAEALEIILDLDREQIDTDPYPKSLSNVSVREAIIEIAKRNDGRLVTKDAAKLLVESGKFVEGDDAGANIFSTLNHNKGLFQREGRGVYRLVRRPPASLL